MTTTSSLTVRITGQDLTSDTCLKLKAAIAEQLAGRHREHHVLILGPEDAIRIEVTPAAWAPVPTLKAITETQENAAAPHRSSASLYMRQFMAEHPRSVLWPSPILISVGEIEDMILADLAEDPNVHILLVREDPEAAAASYKRLSTRLGAAAIGRGCDSLIVRERTTRTVDPSLHVVPVGGSVFGARIDRLYWFCSTPPVLAGLMGQELPADESRADIWAWFHTTVLSRVVMGGTVHVIGAPSHKDDVELRLARECGFPLKTIPLTEEARWPRGGGMDVAALRMRLGPIEAARQIDCKLPES